VIEFVDKSLIQVRCSLEDVADNMISSLQARGEKTSRITSQVTEMLKKTGATCQVTATTLLPPLVDLTGETEIVLTKVVARNLKEVDYETEEVKGTMTDIIVKIIEDDPSQYADGIESQEQILKDCGMSLPEIKAYIASNLPPPPTPGVLPTPKPTMPPVGATPTPTPLPTTAPTMAPTTAPTMAPTALKLWPSGH